jgi:hypothetical protein
MKVSTSLQRGIDEYKDEVNKIIVVERGHVQRYVVDQIKIIDRLEQLTRRMQKYTG